ncbi:MAG: RagB/SusD family nutrient uptake outer membrane protein, partial [Duncaniella sp.]|nr:RagB/SusD family nutrient uptake outer membrane protein [Duncaniella sp.]
MKTRKKLYTLALLAPAMSMMISSCDSYLDVEPKGKTLLETTEDYLGLLEEISPTYDHSYSLNICNEASWYKVEELKNYTTPLRSAGFLWNDSYDRAAITIESTLYNNCYSRITNYNVIVSNIENARGPQEEKNLAMAQAKIMRAYNYFFLVNTFARPYDPATADETNGI